MSAVLRFLSGSRTQENIVPTVVLLPHQRYLHFKTTWYAIQRHSTVIDKWKRQERLIPDIEKICHLLCDECTRADRLAPKACLEFGLQRDIFSWLVTLAIGGPSTLTGCIIKAYTAIIDNQDEDFMTHEIVSSSLTTLFKHLNSRRHKEYLVHETVQLLFVICSKIHHYPPLLSMFFDGTRWKDRSNHASLNISHVSQDASADILRFEEEFLIFYLLIDNMHGAGDHGDFCRTGLLYLIDSCRDSPDIQRWLADSEFPVFLTVGLGSHYSLLGSKLHISNPLSHDLLLATSAGTPAQAATSNDGIRNSSDPDFLGIYEKFLAYLAYWQDVFVISSDSSLRSALIESFRILFLQSILYPSLLESSDLDDGSSAVAVSTYLAAVLEVLTDSELVRATLQYLLASDTKTEQLQGATGKAAQAVGLRATFELDPMLFSLKDMIFDNLRSDSVDTQKATFRLLDVLLTNHWQYSVDTLIRTTRTSQARNTTIGHHKKEMKTLASLIDTEEQAIQSSEAYKDYLHDAMSTLELQDEQLDSLLLVQADQAGNGAKVSGTTHSDRSRHTIHPSDPLLREIMRSFSHFFSNDVESNLILTKLMSDLVACRQRSLEGWLLFSRSDSWIGTHGEIAPDHSMRDRSLADLEHEMIPELEETILSDEEDEDDQSLDYGVESTPNALRSRVLPSWSRFPPVLTMLKTLSAQLRQYKSEIDSLQQDIDQRRQVFRLGNDSEHLDSLLDAAHCVLDASQSRPVLQRGPTSSLFRRTPSSLISPVTTPTRNATSSPFAEHFSSTRRDVSVLPSVSFHDDEESEVPTTPTKVRSKGQSVLDSTASPERPSRTSKKADDGNIKLSKLINNIIIYEEFVKELMAIVQVRRSLYEGCEFV